MVINHEFRSFPLRVGDNIRSANLFQLEMSDFDIILAMYWLTEHCATIVCHTKRVIFGDLNNLKFLYHGCEGFLASIKDTLLDGPYFKSHPVVWNFLDKLPGLPPVCEVELTIELIPGADRLF
ncbi:putative reverse transcriptase domain-containing protein [Tanacetum coccineum]